MMVLSRSLRRFVPLALIVLLLVACGDSSDDAADTPTVTTTTRATTTTTAPPTTTTAPTTTLFVADKATVTRLVDEWNAGSNSFDIDAVMAVLADDFYVKPCPYCAERNDRASIASQMDAMAPINLQTERTTDLQPASGGAYSYQATMCTVEDGHLADVEVESDGVKITRIVTVAWEKHDCT